MLVTLEFADAGGKRRSYSLLIIDRGAEDLQAGDIGLSLDEAKTLIVPFRRNSFRPRRPKSLSRPIET